MAIFAGRAGLDGSAKTWHGLGRLKKRRAAPARPDLRALSADHNEKLCVISAYPMIEPPYDAIGWYSILGRIRAWRASSTARLGRFTIRRLLTRNLEGSRCGALGQGIALATPSTPISRKRSRAQFPAFGRQPPRRVITRNRKRRKSLAYVGGLTKSETVNCGGRRAQDAPETCAGGCLGWTAPLVRRAGGISLCA